MTIDGFLAVFANKMKNAANQFISLYTLCFALSCLGYGSNGLDNTAAIFKTIGLDAIANWLCNLRNQLTQPETIYPTLIMILIWLTIALFGFGALFSQKIPTNLLPQNAIAVAFFWTLYTDIIAPNLPVEINIATAFTATCLIYVALKSVRLGKDFWTPPVFALVSLIVTPLYIVATIPLWLSSEQRANSTLDRLVGELNTLRELVESRFPEADNN